MRLSTVLLVTRRPPDEFSWIERLRPLTRGAEAAADLLDDAAILPSRPGFELVISKDAQVEGVHTLPGEAPEIFARRLLRTALSDLAAKAADPFGYLLMTAWPMDRDMAWREQFIAGLKEDGDRFGVVLLGGDTVSTPGPLVASATVFGWIPQGQRLLRSGARSGDALVICGSIGDGWLGLRAARGEIRDPSGVLARRYRLPEPLFVLRDVLRRRARATIDVSDGLLADAGHLAEASGLAVTVDLDRLPLSMEAADWLAGQGNSAEAATMLAIGGDDYAVACAMPSADVEAFISESAALEIRAAAVGYFAAGRGLQVRRLGARLDVKRTGWRH